MKTRKIKLNAKVNNYTSVDIDVTIKCSSLWEDEILDTLRDRLAQALVNVPHMEFPRGRVKVQ